MSKRKGGEVNDDMHVLAKEMGHAGVEYRKFVFACVLNTYFGTPRDKSPSSSSSRSVLSYDWRSRAGLYAANQMAFHAQSIFLMDIGILPRRLYNVMLRISADEPRTSLAVYMALSEDHQDLEPGVLSTYQSLLDYVSEEMDILWPPPSVPSRCSFSIWKQAALSLYVFQTTYGQSERHTFCILSELPIQLLCATRAFIEKLRARNTMMEQRKHTSAGLSSSPPRDTARNVYLLGVDATLVENKIMLHRICYCRGAPALRSELEFLLQHYEKDQVHQLLAQCLLAIRAPSRSFPLRVFKIKTLQSMLGEGGEGVEKTKPENQPTKKTTNEPIGGGGL